MHSKGVMHRDIKTTNVMLSSEGFVKILDFDLAEFLTPTTDLKYTIGTPGYKAPESFLKQKVYDFRIDIFSSACLMAAMLFQKAPFYEVKDEDEPW